MKKKFISVTLAIMLIFSIATTIAFASGGKLGDMNDDGDITASDARTILRASAKLETLDEDHAKRADTNKDGKISAADARLTLRVAAKLESFPEETTEDEETTEPTPVKIPDTIKAFTSGKYYLCGIVSPSGSVSVDDSELISIKLAVDGSDFEIIMDEEAPISLSLYTAKNKKYLKTVDASGQKMYTELTKELIDFINLMLNSDVEFDTLISDINLAEFSNVGEPVVESPFSGINSYIFNVGNSTVSFLEEKGAVKRIDITNSQGKETSITVLSMTQNIPSDMLTLDGFAKKSIIEIAEAFDK